MHALKNVRHVQQHVIDKLFDTLQEYAHRLRLLPSRPVSDTLIELTGFQGLSF